MEFFKIHYKNKKLKLSPVTIALTLPAHQVSVAIASRCSGEGRLEDRWKEALS